MFFPRVDHIVWYFGDNMPRTGLLNLDITLDEIDEDTMRRRVVNTKLMGSWKGDHGNKVTSVGTVYGHLIVPGDNGIVSIDVKSVGILSER